MEKAVEDRAPMSTYDAVMIAEGVQDAESDEQYLEAWQMLVDTGLAWSLQGFFGRTAKAMIERGLLTVSVIDMLKMPGDA